MTVEAYKGLVIELCGRYGADPSVIAGMVNQESGWRTDAIGDAGHSVGLLQLHDQGLGAGMSVEERKDPRRNLDVGIKAHASYFGEFGNVEDAIAAHNMGGPGVRLAKQGSPKYVELRASVQERYVKPVLEQARWYRQSGAFVPVGSGTGDHDAKVVQLNALWGYSEELMAAGRNEEAWRIRSAVIALKDALGMN